ncbi:MAG TPA: hypothetical protein VI011_24995 [Asanoa sp.]
MVALSVGFLAVPNRQPVRAAVDSVVLVWNQQVLNAIAETRTGPTVAARALAVTHTAIYDAWAAYDPVAVGTRSGATMRRPDDERTGDNKSRAVSFAAYTALVDLFPTRRATHAQKMAELGYDAADGMDTSTAATVGRTAAQAVLQVRHRDGSNQLGDEPGGTPGWPTPTTPDTNRSTPGTRSATPTGGSRCACRCRRRAAPSAPERSRLT